MRSRLIAATLTLGLLGCGSPPSAPNPESSITLAVVSGDGQTVAPGAELPEPVVAVVFDARGKPVKDQLVNFVVTGGGGSVFAGSAFSDKDGLVREWWTVGPAPGANTLEARAVDPATGEKLVFAVFHATAVEPAPSDPLAGTWIGTRRDGITVQYVFVNTGTTGTNGRTGNTAAVYQGTFSGDGLDTQTFGVAFEDPYAHWGAVSQGELTGPNALVVWSDYVEPFTVTRVAGP